VAGAQASYSYDVTAADRMTERRVPGATAGTWRREHTFADDGTGRVGAVRRFGPTGAPLGGVCFRHDGLGRLVFAGRMTVNGTDCLLERNDAGLPEVLGKYRYDPQNRRVARWSTAAGRWSYTAFDGAGNPLSEVALSGGAWQPVRDYVWLDGKPLAQVEYAGGQESSYWLHADHLGLPRAMTNAAQQVVWSAAARPYGDLTETTTPDPLTGRTVVTNLRLPGQYDERLLGGLGLQGPYYNWNRWYLPGVGRYLELDPVAMKGGSTRLEWYAYAGGNPLRFIDPLGLDRYDFCRVCGRTSRWIERTCRRLPDFVCPYAGTYCCDMDYTDCMAQAPDADSPLYNVAWMRCNAIRALCIADPAHRQPADPTAPPRQ